LFGKKTSVKEGLGLGNNYFNIERHIKPIKYFENENFYEF